MDVLKITFKPKHSDDEILAALSNEWCATAHVRKACGLKSSSATLFILLRLAAEGRIEMKEFDGIGRMWRLKQE